MIDWTKAIDHLYGIINMYAETGNISEATEWRLWALKKRYETGERTQALYDDIMKTE